MDSPRKRAARTRRAHCCSRRASGLSAQTGKAAEPCLKAHETVTMIASKPGLETPYAFAFCGTVHVAPLAYIEPILESWKQREAVDNTSAENNGLIGSSAAADANAALEAAAPASSLRPNTTPSVAPKPKMTTATTPIPTARQHPNRSSRPTPGIRKKSRSNARTNEEQAPATHGKANAAGARPSLSGHRRCNHSVPRLAQSRLPHPKHFPSLWHHTQPLFTFRIAQKKRKLPYGSFLP